jgi:hypothetical protein
MHRWEKYIRTDLREIDLKVVDWMYLAQDTDQWGRCYEHGNEMSVSIKGPRIS